MRFLTSWPGAWSNKEPTLTLNLEFMIKSFEKFCLSYHQKKCICSKLWLRSNLLTNLFSAVLPTVSLCPRRHDLFEAKSRMCYNLLARYHKSLWLHNWFLRFQKCRHILPSFWFQSLIENIPLLILMKELFFSIGCRLNNLIFPNLVIKKRSLTIFIPMYRQ